MLRAISRNSSRLVPRIEAVAGAQRGMALEGTKGYPERDTAQETVYFHKEDEKLLKSLLTKVRKQAEQTDPHRATGAKAAELSALNEIVGSKLSDAEKDALLVWKHKQF